MKTYLVSARAEVVVWPTLCITTIIGVHSEALGSLKLYEAVLPQIQAAVLYY